MESVLVSHGVTLAPPLPPKSKSRAASLSGFSESDGEAFRVEAAESARPASGHSDSVTGSMPSALASSSLAGCPARSSTVFLAADEGGEAPRQHDLPSVPTPPRTAHVVTIRINPDSYPSAAGNSGGYNTPTLIINNGASDAGEPLVYKSNTRVSLNQTSTINTIGKFIVNICENGNAIENAERIKDSYVTREDSVYPANGCVRISVNTEKNQTKEEMVQKTEGLVKNLNGDVGSPYFFCNPFPCSQTNVMSSGQCSPSDTLDSGTCSDLDGTPPPLPKKKSIKSSGAGHKRVSVTVIGAAHGRAPSAASSAAEVDSEDSESNISCDSLNSSELSTSSREDHDAATFKSEILKAAILTSERRKSEPPAESVPAAAVMPSAPKMPTFLNSAASTGGFLPQGLLQDIRDRSAKLSTTSVLPAEQETIKTSWAEIEKKPEVTMSLKKDQNIKQEENLVSFKLVSQINCENKKPKITDVLHTQPVVVESIPTFPKIIPIVNESTYEDRKIEQEKQKQDKLLYSGNFLYDTDKYYDFHLNENVFDDVSETEKKSKKKSVLKVNGKNMCNDSSDSEFLDDESMEYFAGIKDYKNEDAPSTIRSAKGTIRGVKNRVRAGIATFLQMQNTTTKSYKEKDAGKVVVYTTSMGIVRGTYQQCAQVKKILRTLLVKFEERDVFMSGEFQEEIKDRMRSQDLMVPQLFVDGHHIGDAETVERLNEAGELRRMLKPYKSADAGSTCQSCGGFRLLPCQVCSGSKKSVHRNHFTAEFVALKCMNCDEVGLVRCDYC